MMARLNKTGAVDGASSVLTRARAMSTLGPLLALILASIFFTSRTDRFLTSDNFSLIVQQIAVVGIIGIGQTLVILTARIDLSAGAAVGFGSIVKPRLPRDHAPHPFLALTPVAPVLRLLSLPHRP